MGVAGSVLASTEPSPVATIVAVTKRTPSTTEHRLRFHQGRLSSSTGTADVANTCPEELSVSFPFGDSFTGVASGRNPSRGFVVATDIIEEGVGGALAPSSLL